MFFLLGFFTVNGFKWNNLKESGLAITGDEVTYISSGYYSLKTGRNFFNPEHPPLVKSIASLPLLFLNPALPAFTNKPFIKQSFPYTDYSFAHEGEIKNNQWNYGRLFLFNDFNNPDLIVFWARTMILLFNAGLLGLVYISIAKIWDKRSALIGLVMAAILPLSLAYGSLVILDFTSSLLSILALVWFAIFLRRLTDKKGGLASFILSAIFISLAILAKTTSLLMLPIMLTVGLVYLLANVQTRALWWNYLWSLIMMSVIICLTIGAVYWPNVRQMSGADISEQVGHFLPAASPASLQPIYAPWARTTVLFLSQGNSFVRGLGEFVLNIFLNVKRADLSEQHKIYFMGHIYGRLGAPIYYYPVLILTKLPVTVLTLMLMAKILFFKNWRKLKQLDLEFILLLSYALIFLAIAMYFNLQMGLRYVLPVILIAVFLVGKILSDNWAFPLAGRYKISVKKATVFLLIIAGAVNLFIYPDFLSYYNLLAGGTANGYKIAVDSSYDWGGQDLKKMAVWLNENQVQTIYVDLFTNAQPAYYLGDAYRPYKTGIDPWPMSGSYVAISAQNYQTDLASNSLAKQKYFTMDNLVDRVGQSIFIFKTP